MKKEDYENFAHYEERNYFRYESYRKNSDLALDKIVTYVNIGLDKPFYTDVVVIKDYLEETVLVNKYRALPKTYEPHDLVELPISKGYKLRRAPADSFLNLITAAKSDGITLLPYSAYRSYEYQELLYDKYALEDGKTLADTYSARAGHSEHQTGLAVDVTNDEDINSLDDSSIKWLEDNSSKYGFIIRYPNNKINITGYMYEEWHLRFIGVYHAAKIKELDITYDEYYDMYIKTS